MIPRFLRFLIRPNADDFFAQAGSRRYGFLRIFKKPTTNSQTLVGIIVAKHVARGAERQKIKRQVRTALIEVYKSSPSLFDASQSVVIVVTQQPTNYQDIVYNLKKFFSE
jgi:ribonuclease P protein component